MRRLLLACVVGCALAASAAPKIAVLELRASAGALTSDEAALLTDLLREQALDRLGASVDVMTRENLLVLLDSTGKKLEECTGECEVDTGRRVGADYVVSGSAAKFGGQLRLAVKLHDTRAGRLLSSISLQAASVAALPDALAKACQKLYAPLAAPPAEEWFDAKQDALVEARRALAVTPDMPADGPASAKVTLVEFGDLQDPFTARLQATLDGLRGIYGDKLRVVFRHFPLSFHPLAPAMSRFAEAARRQGKFAQARALLLSRRPVPDDFADSYARELGLDAARAAADASSAEVAAALARDAAAAERLQLRGTPTSFINGRYVAGAQAIDKFREAIDAALEQADRALARGVPPARLYATLVGESFTGSTAGPATEAPARPAGPVALHLEGAPAEGPDSAPVTLVHFGDFQGPFCARVQPTLQKLAQEYGDKLRIVWKNRVLSFFEQDIAAAEAALAAGEQGRFWEFHDALFADQKRLSPALYEEIAGKLGLDLERFRAAVEDHRHRARIDADSAEGEKVGATGTPTFFVNGRILEGAQPIEKFRALIDAELKRR